jgi:ATP-binding cassette subfamily C exporter for protease/lipase
MQTSRRPLARVRRALLAASVMSACSAALMLVVPMFALQLAETALPARSFELLGILVGIAAAVLLVAGIVDHARELVLLRAALWLGHTAGAAIIQTGLGSGAGDATLRERADALGRLRAVISGSRLPALIELPWTFAACGLLVLIHPTLAITCIAVLLLVLIMSALFRPGSPALDDAARRWLDAACRDRRRADADGLAGGLARRWELSNRRHIAEAYRTGRRLGRARAFVRSAGAAGLVVVMSVGGTLVVADGLLPGVVVAATLLVMRALFLLETVVAGADELRDARRAWRLLAALDLAEGLTEETKAGPGHVRLEAVDCAWPGQRRPALVGIDLDLAPGACIAIVGPRGSGKTTLAALIAGIVEPSAGRGTVDGEPITSRQRAAGRPIGYMADEPRLIGGSVTDSITGLTPDDAEGAMRAAQRAGVHDIIAALPEGFDTDVGDEGRALPMRTRRAVALARVFHGRPRLVVLDEPELALDDAGVVRLAGTLEAARREGIGLVLATADPRLLRITDRIVVLGGGRIQAELPSRHLLAASPAGDERLAA